MLVGVSSCGGGGGTDLPPTPPPEKMVVLSGIVFDDPVDGANVVITALPGGVPLATVTTSASGAYTTPAIAESKLASGWKVIASGGQMLGSAFVGTMQAVYSKTGEYANSNVNLVTSALVAAAQRETNGATLLSNVQATEAKWLSAGSIDASAGLVTATSASHGWIASRARAVGVDAAIQEAPDVLTPLLQARTDGSTSCLSTPLGPTVCEALIGAQGGAVYSASGTAQGARLIDVPAVAGRCVMRVSATYSAHRVTAKVVASPSLNGCSKAIGAAVTVSLPAASSSDPGLNACEAVSSHPAMTKCLTLDAGIQTGYFVSGDGGNHRILGSTHTTKAAISTLERSFGAHLKRPVLASESEMAARTAVIFIHGFKSETTEPVGGSVFGGDEGTWGYMPELVLSLTPVDGAKLLPLNFQWRTDVSFYQAAQELAQAINYVYSKTNRPVHIVAHSFGGVLVRTVLQRAGGGLTNVDWSGRVASLTTIGTPHSGIRRSGAASIYGVNLPIGWDGGVVQGNSCLQLSCYQVGLDNNIGDLGKSLLTASNGLPVSGYLAADLANTVSALPSGLYFQVLIGQRISDDTSSAKQTFMSGDGLISYYGQRFIPTGLTAARDRLLMETQLGGAKVSERILGLNATVNAFPQDPVGSTMLSAWMTSNLKKGYAHISLLVRPFIPLIGQSVDSPEVEIPQSLCPGPSTCLHDTWVHLRSLILSLHGGVAATNFPSTTGKPVVSVTSARCTEPAMNQLMTCVLAGTNLPTTTSIAASNCNPAPMLADTGGSSTQRQFTCTPSVPKAGVVITVSIPGYLGVSPSIEFFPTTTGSFLHETMNLSPTGITNLQCVSISPPLAMVVRCSDPAATALNARQDGMGRPGISEASYTKLDVLGTVLKGDSQFWDCVKDNDSGLTWEAKKLDTGLHGIATTFTNFTSTVIAQKQIGTDINSFVPYFGFPTAGEVNGTTNLLGLAALMNRQNYCGYSDWRIPSIRELAQITDYGGQLQGTFRPKAIFSVLDNRKRYVWSSSGYNNAYVQNFSLETGTVAIGGYFTVRSELLPGVLVRGRKITDADWVVSSDGKKVKDERTGLLWERCLVGQSWSGLECTGQPQRFSYTEALKFAQTQSNLRMPNIVELLSILRFETDGLKVETQRIFAAPPDLGGNFFATGHVASSTPSYISSIATGGAGGWVVDFLQGFPEGRTNLKVYIRLVSSN